MRVITDRTEAGMETWIEDEYGGVMLSRRKTSKASREAALKKLESLAAKLRKEIEQERAS